MSAISRAAGNPSVVSVPTFNFIGGKYLKYDFEDDKISFEMSQWCCFFRASQKSTELVRKLDYLRNSNYYYHPFFFFNPTKICILTGVCRL